ncbi:FG-GAP-like repeat-containing protein [Pseudoalteromonas phenolica]|nr:FG-GAP-like repeat-containing protein [Pseudoalteromonas phenolica]
MKTKLSLIGLCVSLNCVANEVDLTVMNGGTVNYSGSSCNENCKIDTSDNDVILTPSNSDTLLFSNWSGQSCDFGKGGTFSTEVKRISKSSGGAKTLQVLDINNDGNADLFSISLFSGAVAQSINKGNGEFETKTVIQDLTYPAALDSYDWNEDGYEDLLVSDFINGAIKVYLNDGNGTLTLSEEIKVSGIRPYAFSVFESEGVEGPQLIISSFLADTSGNLSQLVNSIREAKTAIYAKDGSSFKETRILSEQASITLDSYVTEKGKLNIVSAEIAAKQVVIYAEADNFEPKKVEESRAPYGAAFADIDKDGIQDVVTAHYGPYSLRVGFAESENVISNMQEIVAGSDGLTAVAVADFDLDGLNDVATGEFNSDRFDYYSMETYLGCGFKKGASAEVTANFEQGTTQQSSSSSSTQSSGQSQTTETAKSESSGGGSLPLWLAALVPLSYLRRKFQ